MAKDKDDEGSFWRTVWLCLLILGVVCGVVTLWQWLGVQHFKSFEKAEEASHYGESFGYVNALFSALALAGVAIAIYLQMNELSLQRRELRLTKNELAKSATAHQELVKLSALSTLLQTYLEEYQLNAKQYKDEFNGLLREAPHKATNHIWYRILVLRAEIEAINAKASGKEPDGVPDVSVANLRRERWGDELRFAASDFRDRWAKFKGEPNRIPAIHAVETITKFTGRLKELEKWMDAIAAEYQNPLQLLRNSLEAFAKDVDPTPFPAHDDGGGNSPGPALPSHHHELGDGLCERAMTLAECVRTGKPCP